MRWAGAITATKVSPEGGVRVGRAVTCTGGSGWAASSIKLKNQYKLKKPRAGWITATKVSPQLGGGRDGWRLHARRFRIGGFKVEKYKKPVKLGKSSTSLRALATVAKSSCCEGRTSSPRNRRWSHASVSSAHRKPPCHRGRGRHPCTRRRPGTRRPRGSMDASKQRRKDSIAASASLPSRRRCRSRCFGSCLGHASRHATGAGIACFGRRRRSCLV